MKRLFLIILSLFFLITSCAKRKPEGILPEDKMADLMTDVYILDGYLNTLMIDSSRQVMPALYEGVFSKYGLDSAAFVKNLAHYQGDPVALDRINTIAKEKINDYSKEAYRVDSLVQARTRDSVSRVTRLQQMASEAQQLLINVHLDTAKYTFRDNNYQFFVRLPLQFVKKETELSNVIVGEGNPVQQPQTQPKEVSIADTVAGEPVPITAQPADTLTKTRSKGSLRRLRSDKSNL